MSKNFIDNIKGIINNKIHIYHSHISNEGMRTVFVMRG